MIDLLLLLVALQADSRAAEPSVKPLDRAIGAVEQIRGLEFSRTVEHRSATRDQLRSMILEQIAREEGDVESYGSLLQALLLVPRGDDPVEGMLRGYEHQVLAWYDPDSKHFYELKDRDDLVMNESMRHGLLVHELTHALQDQRFGAGGRLREHRRDWDRAQAYHAVLEGEATLVMLGATMEAMGASLGQLRDSAVPLDTMLDAMESTAAAMMPPGLDPWFVESMTFPYVQGLRFVMGEWRAGGWEAVDAIHANPPISTEEILHPEIWRSRLGRQEAERPAPRAGSADVIHAGEFILSFLAGRDAAAGVDEATFRVRRQRDDGWEVSLTSTWDSPEDAREFEQAYRSLLEARGVKGSVRRKGLAVSARYIWRAAATSEPAPPRAAPGE